MSITCVSSSENSHIFSRRPSKVANIMQTFVRMRSFVDELSSQSMVSSVCVSMSAFEGITKNSSTSSRRAFKARSSGNCHLKPDVKCCEPQTPPVSSTAHFIDVQVVMESPVTSSAASFSIVTSDKPFTSAQTMSSA